MNTEFFDSFDGTRLALHRHGEGRPFVLLHGLFSNAQMNWIKFGHHERIAAQGYEVLMLDFRVHGESDAHREIPKTIPATCWCATLLRWSIISAGGIRPRRLLARRARRCTRWRTAC